MKMTRRAGLAGLMASTATMGFPRIGRAEEPEIVIGAPNSLTGGLAEGGKTFIDGLSIAIDKINREGGIKSLGGAKLRAVIADTTSENAAQAASVTRRIIDLDKAVIIAGVTASAMTLAAQIECEKSQIPLVTNSYADPIVLRGMKYTFKILPQGGAIWNYGMDTVYEMFKATKGAPPKSCIIVMSNDAVGLVVQKKLPEEAKKIGLEVVQSFGYQMGLTDPSVAVAPVLQLKPDVIFLGAFLNDLILIVNALRSLGITAPIVNGGVFNTESVGNALGKNLEHLMGVCTGNWDLPVPGVSELVDAYRKAHPDKSHYPPNEQLEIGYSTGIIIRDTLEKAASREGPKLREVLANTEFTGLPVPIEGGKVKYGPDGLNIYNNSILAEWQDGKLRTIWPKRVQTVPPII
jgi:branched-chain amino acid transport system substrate-binding protein